MDAEMKELLSKLFEEIHSIKSDLNKQGITLDKQGITIEKIQTDIKTIAEVQISNLEQNQREHKEIMDCLEGKTNLMGSVIKDLTNDIQDLKESNKSIYEVLGEHDITIRTFKRKQG